ncbi:MAG: ASCH domain-containing protein [Pseudomonadota bacterium]|nr:ASCH domain-containing protein [Pseudomonadota bacterium]
MKCLTICQPYAHLIVTGAKRVENRSWPTRYRGPLLIHAGVSRAWMDCADAHMVRCYGEPLVFGAVVGRAQLVECVLLTEITHPRICKRFPWLRKHDHAEGPWCWVLEDVERFMVPTPIRGRLGLFDVPDNFGAAPLAP